jgi:tRNA threonylcarbamoyladenosine biosynthesis protein TsaE
MQDEFILPMQLTTTAVEQTEAFGALLAHRMLQDSSLPRYIALRGDLGVGKTAFIRGFVSVAAPGAAVRSPTFALVNEYRARGTALPVFHFDMYRITDEEDLYSIGYYDYLDHGICLVEWSENIPYAFPEQYLSLTIEKDDITQPDHRRLTLRPEYAPL